MLTHVRISLAVLIAVAVYAAVSPPFRADAMEQSQPEPILVEDFNTGLPPIMRTSFGTAGEFRFITPIAPNPHDQNADFDPDLLPSPTLKLAKADGRACTPGESFTSTTAPDRIRIENKQGRFFIVNWTTGAGFENTPVYRISVDVPGETLGSVDLPPSAYRQWGRTWPIKFIVERDPALWARMLAAGEMTLWEVADELRTRFGLCDNELRDLLVSAFPDAADDQVAEVVNGICQDVELFPTTKIADKATRDALALFDMSTGRMVFVGDTAILRSLFINDVIASRQSPAAPYGYLRKITSIRKSKGIYTLETVQAKFTEAIKVGKLQASGPLLLGSSEAASIQNSRSALNGGAIAASFDEGDQYTFKEHIETTINLDGGDDEIGGTGTVTVIGDVYINAGYNIGAGIEWCGVVPCADRLEAWMGFEQKTDLRIIGDFQGKVHKEIAYPVPMEPIFFMIGPLPVILVPEVNVIVGVDGKAQIDFEFKAGSEVTMKPYLKWTDDNGGTWQDLTKIDDPLSKTYSDVDITGTIEMEVFAKLDAALLLYGAIGPSMDGGLGVGARAPSREGRLWEIYGHAKVGIGLRSVITELFDIGSPREALLDEEFQITEAQNAKPDCSGRDGVIPVDIDSRVFLGPSGNGIGGYFNCTDPDGDSSQLEYAPQSSDPADRFSNMWTRFLTADQRTVRITATDQDGETEEVVLTFKPQNTLPVISPYAATNTVGVGVQYFINAIVYDWELRDYLDCDGFEGFGGVSFHVEAPNTAVEFGGDFNCSAEVVFASPGPHTILIAARDKDNGYSEQLVTVNVTAAPADTAPVIDRSSINFSAVARTQVFRTGDSSIIVCFPGNICPLPNGENIDIPGQTLFDYILPFHLNFDATDSGGQDLTKKWYCRWVANTAVTAEMNQNPDGSFGCSQAPPGAPIFVWGTVTDGTTTIYTDMRTYVLGSGLT